MWAAISFTPRCAATTKSSPLKRPISARLIHRGSLELAEFATVDVSFISLKLVLPAVEKLLQPRAALVALIKPQFEAGRRDSKKGIVRDPLVHAEICEDMKAFVIARGWRSNGIVPSPILGGDGNREFLLEAERG